jgi:hypothetical protein
VSLSKNAKQVLFKHKVIAKKFLTGCEMHFFLAQKKFKMYKWVGASAPAFLLPSAPASTLFFNQ